MKNQNAKNNFGNNFKERNCKNSNTKTLKSVSNKNDDQELFKDINSIEGLINSKKFEIEREESSHSTVILENGIKKTDHSTEQNTDKKNVQDVPDINDAEIIIKLDDEEDSNLKTIQSEQNKKRTNLAETTNTISINHDKSNTKKNSDN